MKLLRIPLKLISNSYLFTIALQAFFTNDRIKSKNSLNSYEDLNKGGGGVSRDISTKNFKTH